MRILLSEGHRAWRLVAAMVAVLGIPAAVGAQIYSWRDTDGLLVLSDRRPSGTSVTTYPVAGTQTVRSTRPVSERPSRSLEQLIQEHATVHQVRPDLVRAVIQTESAFDSRARSVKGAQGLMQLMPDTAVQYAVLDPYDPNENIRAGVAYLRDLLTRYEGNEELALAAYNAGPTAVDKYGQHVPPYRETRAYVERVRNATAISTTPRSRIYKVVELVDGREVIRYTKKKPGPACSEVTSARRR
jgi:hypothetical protein